MYVKYFISFCLSWQFAHADFRLPIRNSKLFQILNMNIRGTKPSVQELKFRPFFFPRHKVAIWWRADLLIYLHCVLHVHCTHIDHMQVPPRQRVKTGVWEDSPLGRPHRMYIVQGVPQKSDFLIFWWLANYRTNYYISYQALVNIEKIMIWPTADLSSKKSESNFFGTPCTFNMHSNGIGLRNYQKKLLLFHTKKVTS